MSITGGVVDSHHETELSPSTRLIHTSWLARHMGVLLAVGVAAAAWLLLA